MLPPTAFINIPHHKLPAPIPYRDTSGHGKRSYQPLWVQHIIVYMPICRFGEETPAHFSNMGDDRGLLGDAEDHRRQGAKDKMQRAETGEGLRNDRTGFKIDLPSGRYIFPTIRNTGDKYCLPGPRFTSLASSPLRPPRIVFIAALSLIATYLFFFSVVSLDCGILSPVMPSRFSKSSAAGVGLLLLATATNTAALIPKDGKTGKLPALGFNSWNAFRCDIHEDKFLVTAEKMVSLGLKDSGYEYVNIDDCWSLKERDPATKRIVPDPERFPDGIKGTADKVHALGLKLGIYSDAGDLTCAGYPGSLYYEAIDAKTWDEWGVDCKHPSQLQLSSY